MSISVVTAVDVEHPLMDPWCDSCMSEFSSK